MVPVLYLKYGRNRLRVYGPEIVDYPKSASGWDTVTYDTARLAENGHLYDSSSWFRSFAGVLPWL